MSRRWLNLTACGLAMFCLAGCGVAGHVMNDRPPPPELQASVEVYDPFDSRSVAVPIQVPANAPADLRNALEQIRSKQWDQARALLEGVCDTAAGEYRARLFLGLIHENRGNWDEAMSWFEAANDIRANQLAQEGIERCRAKQAIERGE